MNLVRDELETQIRTIMDDEKIYLMEDLTLNVMSTCLNTLPEVLSAYISQTFGQNFKGYINSYRIQEAITIFGQTEKPDILRTAMDVGFGSYSTFHRAFLKETGQTPGAYVKSLADGSVRQSG